MVLELALLRVVVINRIEEILVEIVPLLEGKLLAEYTWRDVGSDDGMDLCTGAGPECDRR